MQYFKYEQPKTNRKFLGIILIHRVELLSQNVF